MRRTKSNRPEPLAKAFTKDNQIYFRLQTALMEDVSYNSVIGRNLVNFAFLDQDLLERCMLEFFAVYVQRRDRGVHPDSIEEELVERSRRLFVRNSYLSIYLLGYVQFLMDEEIDPRIFSGITGDDKSLLNLIQREKPDGIPDALKSGMISVLIRSYESKRRRSEKALKIVWEASQGDTRTPVERYCKLEQEDSFFRKHWHSTFMTTLGVWDAEMGKSVRFTVLETIDDMLRYEMVQLLIEGVGYKFCKNCGMPFIPSGRSDALYCDRVMTGQEKPCNKIGANLAAKKKVNSNPALKIYRQAYQRMNKRMEQGYLEREEYDAWVKAAAEKRDRCVVGELPYKEFAGWIDGTSRQR